MLLLLLTLVILFGTTMILTLRSYNNYNIKLNQQIVYETKLKEERERIEKEKKEQQEREERERKERLEREERERKERLEREERERKYLIEKEERERKERLEREERERAYILAKEKRDRKERFVLADKANYNSLVKESLAKDERINLRYYTDEYNSSHLKNQLTFDQLMDSINLLISRVWTHEEHFYLKANDITIPKIEEESARFGCMVMQHMSNEMRRQAMLYLTQEGLVYYINGTFNDLIWKYATDRNELQGLYKALYQKNRDQLKRDLAKVREEAKSERLIKYGNNNGPDDIGSGSNNFY